MLPNTMHRRLDIQSSFEFVNGQSVAYVPQNPFTALSPLTKIKDQFFISEQKMHALMQLVDLDAMLLERYAPELSGGQLQRMIIALALSSNPRLLMLDEPTTALDPQTRVVIIDLLKRLQKELDFKMLFVTHDMHSAEVLCDEICIIKNGSVIESGLMHEVIASPRHEYTKMLIEANFAHRKFRE